MDSIEEKDDKLPSMGILDHLEDLRKTIFKIILSVLIFLPFTLYFAEDFLDYCANLSNVSGFYAHGPMELFIQRIKIGFVLALFLAMPFILFQVWRFFAPALYDNEKKTITLCLRISYVLFILGIIFGFFVIIPISLNFFNALQTNSVFYQPRLEYVINFILMLSFGSGIISQLPILVVILNRLGVVSIENLSNCRSYVVVGIFIVAAIVTPPDVISQVALAVPTWINFELSLLFCRFLAIKNDRQKRRKFIIYALGIFVSVILIIAGVLYKVYDTKKQYDKTTIVNLISSREGKLELFKEYLATKNNLIYKSLMQEFIALPLNMQQRLLQDSFDLNLSLTENKLIFVFLQKYQLPFENLKLQVYLTCVDMNNNEYKIYIDDEVYSKNEKSFKIERDIFSLSDTLYEAYERKAIQKVCINIDIVDASLENNKYHFDTITSEWSLL